MSIELCQSSTSASLMWAKTPRLDASLMKWGSRACRSTMTGQAASRAILSISVIGALAESDEGDVGALAGGDGADVGDVDLSRDHLVSQRDDDRRDEGETVFAFVRDQDAQMLGVAFTHRQARSNRA
jgi:hypothetical protein